MSNQSVLAAAPDHIADARKMVAPAVQGEPVAWQLRTPEGRSEYRPWQLPAAWQPCPEGVREGAPYDDPAFESLCREHEIWGTAAAAQCAVFWEAGKRAEQQPAPDVKGLVEALEAALMVMTSKEVRLEKQADAITIARAVLAAHHIEDNGNG